MFKKKPEKAYAVIGLGRFGEDLAIMLAESGKEVIVADRDENKIKEMRQYTEYAFVVENLNKETLKEMGIQNCDVAIICIGEQVDISILTTMSVLELGVPRVISNALSAEQGAVLEKLGAEVVYPERDMAVRLGKKLLSGQLIDYVALLHDVEIRQIQVPESLNGKTVEEIELRQKFRLNIIAIENISGTNTEVIPENVLKKDDIIVVIGKIKNINSFEESL